MNTYIFVSHRNLSQCIRSKQTTQFESYWARVRFYHLVLAVFTFRFVRLSQVTRVVCPFVHTSMRWKMSGWKWAMWGDWYLNLVFSVCILRPFNFLTHSTWLFFVGLPERPLNKKKNIQFDLPPSSPRFPPSFFSPLLSQLGFSIRSRGMYIWFYCIFATFISIWNCTLSRTRCHRHPKTK